VTDMKSASEGKPKRTLVVSMHYRPEQNFIVADVAERLARTSEVVVVTAHPNYPLGKFYSGSRFPAIQKSVENGVTIWRLPYFPDHSLSVVRRALSYLSFALVASVVAPFVAGRPNAVWVYHGPFTTGLVALFFRFVYGSRLVITCADLWPDSFVGSRVVSSSVLLKLASGYNRLIHKSADFIVCSTRGILLAFQQMNIPPDRLKVIPVWIEGTQAVDSEKLQAKATRGIVYTGNLGPAQGLDTVVKAAGILRDLLPDLSFDFIGSGASVEALQLLAAQLGASNVVFHGRVSTSEAFDAAASSVAQLVCLQRSQSFSRTVPSKLFSAFAASRPILYGLEGEAAELAMHSGGGVPFNTDNPESLVDAIKRLLAMDDDSVQAMRRRLNEYFIENFEPTKLLAQYELVLGDAEPARNTDSQATKRVA
jgi:colanic acid biosynthesis glycosyl transferase WcaI